MKKYVTNPDTLILGQSIQAVFNSINFDEMESIFAATMKKYHYDDTTIDPTAWYPLQMVLDFYHDLTSGEDLVSVGVKIFDAAQTPPEIDSISKAIELLIAIHNLNLKNIPAEDGYKDLVIEDRHVRFTEVTSFPHDLFYGYIYSICRRFKPVGADVRIQRTYLNPDDPNSDGAVYDITW